MAVSIEKDLAVVDRGLTALRVDYERFFTGELKRPPVVLRRSIAETLKRCGNEQVERAAERFRLQSLQARFTAMTELWDKRLQVREEGRDRVFRVQAPVRSAGAAPPAPDADASASVRKGRRTN